MRSINSPNVLHLTLETKGACRWSSSRKRDGIHFQEAFGKPISKPVVSNLSVCKAEEQPVTGTHIQTSAVLGRRQIQ